MRSSMEKILVAVVGVLVVAVALAACGGGGSSSGSEGTIGASNGSPGNGGEEGGNTAALTEAKEEIAKFIGRPSPFPVTENLNELPPKGAKVAMLLSGTPVSAILAEAAEEAEKPLGVDLIPIKAGPSAALAQSGADAAVAMHPDAVLDEGVSLELLGKQMKELGQAGTPVVTVGELDTEQYGIKNPQAAGPWAEQNGRLMADYVAAEFGTDSNVVFYGVPELGFSAVEEEAFQKQLEKVCPECAVRSVGITIEEIGTTAPNTVVSDLQANPETNVTVYGAAEDLIGVPQALSAAGIDVKSIGVNPSPTVLQYIKEGKVAVGLSTDLPVASWQQMDQVAREIIGQPELSGPASEGLQDTQFLRPQDITFDPEQGLDRLPRLQRTVRKAVGAEIGTPGRPGRGINKFRRRCPSMEHGSPALSQIPTTHTRAPARRSSLG